MSEGILFELRFFLRAVSLGILMMLLYELLRIFRRLVHHRFFAVAVEDILYWLVCGICIFRMMYLENSGAIRGFAIVAVVLGMLGYLQMIKIYQKLQNKLRNKLQHAKKKRIM
jgi:spore cortex biosynthesis protein YabQ